VAQLDASLSVVGDGEAQRRIVLVEADHDDITRSRSSGALAMVGNMPVPFGVIRN
jgi:hypothetical protein